MSVLFCPYWRLWYVNVLKPSFILLQIMDETQTQIAWPSKLKIGAKSKKGVLFVSLFLVILSILILDPFTSTLWDLSVCVDQAHLDLTMSQLDMRP